MSELVIDESDPRILREVIRSDDWKTVTRSLVRIDGVIWIKLGTFYKQQGWGSENEWGVLTRKEENGTILPQIRNDLHDSVSADLDRHEIELEHATDPLNSKALAGGAL
jgi:hypothetical protein